MALPVIPNIALGKVVEYCQLAKDKPTGFANAGLSWRLLTGTIDGTVEGQIRDADTFAAIVALAVDEATFTGYTAGGFVTAAADITVGTPDDSANTNSVDVVTNPTWNPTSAQNLTGIVLCFDPDTTTGTDSTVIPLFVDAMVVTTGTGGAATPLTYQIASGGFVVCSQA